MLSCHLQKEKVKNPKGPITDRLLNNIWRLHVVESAVALKYNIFDDMRIYL